MNGVNRKCFPFFTLCELRAIEALRRRTDRLDDCMRALQMKLPRALLWKRIARLRRPS